MLDFWQNIFAAIFRGLGKQAYFNILNFVSYYGICVPLAVVFAFYYGTNNDSNNPRDIGLGNAGIWIGFCIGMVFQIIAQNISLKWIIDWQ